MSYLGIIKDMIKEIESEKTLCKKCKSKPKSKYNFEGLCDDCFKIFEKKQLEKMSEKADKDYEKRLKLYKEGKEDNRTRRTTPDY